jgi:hypothetical protein
MTQEHNDGTGAPPLGGRSIKLRCSSSSICRSLRLLRFCRLKAALLCCGGSLTLLSIPLFIAALTGTGLSAEGPLLDDRQISINAESDIGRLRQSLIQYIWGYDQLPKRMPDRVAGAASPMANMENLEKVESIFVLMEAGQQTTAYHYIPRNRQRRLVIVHQGHACDTGAAGVGNAIRDLVRSGYSVLAMNMPRCREGDCSSNCTAAHNEMFATIHLSQGTPLKFFLEPIVTSLNYLQSHGVDGTRYREFNMVGLSGGGWTTTVYAAIDPRITLSFPVAGTMPLYLRHDGSVGDLEQTLPVFYRIAGYPDLYVLGSYGTGRKQVQILNERDDCCFGMAQHKTPATYQQDVRGYERLVQQKLERLGMGAFKLEIDTVAPSHMISGYASTNMILRELNQHKPNGSSKP